MCDRLADGADPGANEPAELYRVVSDLAEIWHQTSNLGPLCPATPAAVRYERNHWYLMSGSPLASDHVVFRIHNHQLLTHLGL